MNACHFRSRFLKKKKLKLAVSFFEVILLVVPWQFLTVIFPASFPTQKAQADTKTITTTADFSKGYFTQTQDNSEAGQIELSPDGTWNARDWKTPDIALTDGATITTDGTYTYLLIQNSTLFYRYLPTEDRWQRLANAPHSPGSGADMIVLGDYIYALYGGYQKEFSRYSISTNTWQDVTNLPDLTFTGSSIQTDGTNLYVLKGGSTQDFWRYNVSSDTWTTLTNTPATMGAGADLIYYSGSLYTLRGANTTTMYKYDISSNTWSTLTVAPSGFNDEGNVTIKGSDIYVLKGSNTTSFYKYSITSNTWTTLSNTPTATRYVGLVYNSSDDKIYIFRGNGTYDWWKYDTDTDSYDGTVDLPAAPTTGGDLVYLNGLLYYRRGGSANFYSINLSSNATTTLTNASASFSSNDNKGATASGKLYFFQGSNSNFYSYDTAGGTWSTLATTPTSVSNGGSLAYPGSGDYLYAVRGAGTASFWRYSISGNTWDDAGAADLPSGVRMNVGARLVSDSQNVYALTSDGTNELYKYDIGKNTWTDLGSLPFSSYYGTDVVYYNGKIYAQSGYYDRDMWEYTISTNTWRRVPYLPGYYAQNIGPYTGGSLAADPQNGVLYSTNGGIVRLTSLTLSSYNYPISGTWESGAIDLNYATNFSSLNATTTTPGNSSVSFETRTSSDSANWSSWQSVSGTAIASLPNRYIDIRATLNSTSDRISSPDIESISVTYTGDTTAPVNPTAVTAKSQEVGGVSLTSGNSYKYTNPYFTWSGASDTESDIAGYYVYFGTSSVADPETDGTFQTSNTYSVTTGLTTGTYYLILETKDSAGNISSSAQEFTYIYDGVSPPQISTHNTSSDFSDGTSTDVTTSNNTIKLTGQAGFWQQKRISNAPSTFSYGGSIVYVSSSNKIYALRGSNTSTFYSYDIATDTWTTLANTPAAIYIGANLVQGPSGYLYATRGNNTSSFYRYDIANDTWSDASAADLPSTIYYGSSLIYDGNQYIYALRGNNDDAVYRYDTTADSWDSLPNTDFGATTLQFTNNVYMGGDLAYDSSGGILYAIQGNKYTGFAQFDTVTQTWSHLPNLPALPYLGANIVYDSNSNSIIYTPGNNSVLIFKYDISTQKWTQLSDIPATLYMGADLKDANGTLYVLRGNSSSSLYEYDIATDSWFLPTVGLFGGYFEGTDYYNYGYGAQIQKGDGDNYYILRGNYDNAMVRYNSSTGETDKMADVPYGLYQGSAVAYDSVNNKLYVIPNQYVQKLLVYDVATDSWSEDTTDAPPALPSTGASLEYDGSRYIYFARGGNSVVFYRFDTQATAGSRWSSTLANAPAALSYGSHLVFKNNYVYTLRGNNANPNPLYRYDPSGNSWTTLSSLPDNVYNDGFLVDGGDDNLYACAASNQVECYEYSITGNSWTSISDAPANISAGGAGAGNLSDRFYMIPGSGSNSYNDAIYSYIQQTQNSSFVDAGTYISPTYNFSSVYKYANLTLSETIPNNTTVEVYTRSSTDGTNWDNWNQADGEKISDSTHIFSINSSPNPYIQAKFVLSSGDNIYSPSITSYSISYYQDTTAPQNPTTISGFNTSTQSAALTTGNWYNYSSPYFSWPQEDATGGATDGSSGAGVKGYYVYFGTNVSADPKTDGTFQTTTNYTASNLTSGQTYYLRIKTADNALNDSSTMSAYTYKFDNVAPDNPTTVTADPSGYTAVNDFAFAWSGASDDASGIKDYCYKTSLAGSETCGVSVASISGVLAGSTGASTFYVRARDNAGNIAPSYASVSYYYSATAPSAPQNLQVSPTSNSVNQFSFSWDPPAVYFGAQSALRYYYSVNALPTANNVNVLGLTSTNLATDAYATVPGANIMYVVAKDEAGNIDYNNYAQVTFTANTSAPGIPKNMDIADISVKADKVWKLAITWEAPTASGSGVSTYKVYHSAVDGASCSTDFSDFSYIASTTGRSYVDTDLTQQNHYYCVRACDSTNNCSAVSSTVTDFPTGKYLEAADLTASPSATVRTKSSVISWQTSRTSNSFVQYGTESGKYGAEVGSSTQTIVHDITLENLEPGTTYYYKVLWTDEDGNTGQSDEQTFTTNPAPFISKVTITNISLYSAYVNFTVKNATSANIKYGQTLSYGGSQSISTSKDETTYTVVIDKLLEGTTYNLQIDAEDEEGNVFSSDNYSFDTLPVPKIVAYKTSQVPDQPTAVFQVLWVTNTVTSSIVTYYPSDEPAGAQDQINLALTKNHQMVLKNLKDNSDYTFVIKGKDSAGNDVDAQNVKIKTATDLRPPVIQNLSVESTITGVGQDAKAQVIVNWDTDEPSTTQVEYGEGTSDTFGQTTQEDTNLTLNHTVTVSGLSPSTIYHLRAKSNDKAGNVANSSDNVVVTPSSTQSAFNLVIDNLSKTFSFLKGFSQ
jgi:hypothetical protein